MAQYESIAFRWKIGLFGSLFSVLDHCASKYSGNIRQSSLYYGTRGGYRDNGRDVCYSWTSCSLNSLVKHAVSDGFSQPNPSDKDFTEPWRQTT